MNMLWMLVWNSINSWDLGVGWFQILKVCLSPHILIDLLCSGKSKNRSFEKWQVTLDSLEIQVFFSLHNYEEIILKY